MSLDLKTFIQDRLASGELRPDFAESLGEFMADFEAKRIEADRRDIIGGELRALRQHIDHEFKAYGNWAFEPSNADWEAFLLAHVKRVES